MEEVRPAGKRLPPTALQRSADALGVSIATARVPVAEWPSELFVVEVFVRRRDVMLSRPSRCVRSG